MAKVLLFILRLLMPKVREQHDSLRKMRKEDPEIQIHLDKIKGSHEELQRTYREFKEKYPNSELLKDKKYRL